MKSLFVRLLLGVFMLILGLSGNAAPLSASVTSFPTFELDASNPSSLATTSATTWRDVISNGSIFGTLVGDAAYSSDSGGSLTVSGPGNGGISFPATVAGTSTNPSGDMSLMMWVKFASWNTEWNLLASRWFTNSTGSGTADWHFAVRSLGATRYLNLWTTNKSNTFGTTTFETNTWYQVGFTLTWAGNLQLYINGVADGPEVTGATRNASTSSQLWISDARTNCNACSMNGSIGRFRIWNSKLDSTQVLNDFNLERENFGYSPTVPVNSVVPAISGTPSFYETLTATTGTWANAPSSYSYQWSRSGSSGGSYSDIPGATNFAYRLGTADVAQFLKVTVTATNSGGSTAATSIATSQIATSNVSASISLDAGTLVYRQAKVITATASVAGKVTFKVNGKKLPGCVNKRISSLNAYIATCSYKPSTRGYIRISATLTPTNNSYIGSTTTSERLFVGSRSGSR